MNDGTWLQHGRRQLVSKRCLAKGEGARHPVFSSLSCDAEVNGDLLIVQGRRDRRRLALHRARQVQQNGHKESFNGWLRDELLNETSPIRRRRPARCEP